MSKIKFWEAASLTAMFAIIAVPITVEAATNKSEIQEVTILGKSGPVEYGAQWTTETDKGPIRFNGFSSAPDMGLDYGGDIANAVEIGKTYCSVTQQHGAFFQTILGEPEMKAPYHLKIAEKPDNKTCEEVFAHEPVHL